MNDKDPSASSENRLSETESSPMPRGLSFGAGGARSGGEREAIQKTGEPKQVKIVLRIEAVESRLAGVAPPAVETLALALPQSPPSPSRQESEPQQIPARMLNEFVYCQRLFYYEFVEGVFVESVDTLRGDAIHKRVDSGNGALPATKKKTKKTTQDEPAAAIDATAKEPEAQNAEGEMGQGKGEREDGALNAEEKTMQIAKSSRHSNIAGDFGEIHVNRNEAVVGLSVLHLNLRREFFAQIAAKTKRIEYRDYKPYWRKRLEGRKYDVIQFRNGYATNAPEMLVEFRGMGRNGNGHKDVAYHSHCGDVGKFSCFTFVE